MEIRSLNSIQRIYRNNSIGGAERKLITGFLFGELGVVVSPEVGEAIGA